MSRRTRLLAALLSFAVACDLRPTQPPPEPQPEPPDPPAEPPPEPPVEPPPEPPAPVGSDTISAMTFNIFNDSGSESFGIPAWTGRREMVVRTIEVARADIVGLQEAYMWQVDWLLQQLPAYSSVGRGRDADGGGESVSILFDSDRFTLEESGDFWLSSTPDAPGSTGGSDWGGANVPRIVTWARLGFQDSDRALYVYNTHLASNENGGAEARRLGTVLLAHRIAARSSPDVPFILLGDLNSTDTAFPLRYLRREVRACAPTDCAGGETDSPVAVVDTWGQLHTEDDGTRCRNGAGGPIVHGDRVDYVLVIDTMRVDGAGDQRWTADGVLSSSILTPTPACASDHVGVVSGFVVP